MIKYYLKQGARCSEYNPQKVGLGDTENVLCDNQGRI